MFYPPPPGGYPTRTDSPPDIPVPSGPKKLGPSLVKAGQRMKNAAPKLKNAAGAVRRTAEFLHPASPLVQGVQSVMNGLNAIRLLLQYPTDAFDAIAGFLDDIKVPTIERQTGVIMGITVVTTLTVGSRRPFRSVAEECRKVSQRIFEIRVAMLTITTSWQTLVDRTPEIRNAVLEAADGMEAASGDLDQTGDALIEAGSGPTF